MCGRHGFDLAAKYTELSRHFRNKQDLKNKIYTVAISRGALLGANANNGANAGFGYLNANNRSSNSNANIGFRFYRDF